MGVWQRSPGARRLALESEHLLKTCRQILPDFKEGDIQGSPYAVYNYQLEPEFGSPEELSALRRRLNAFGLKLILDFVPNHLALDHPAVETNPDYFIQASKEDLEKDPGTFFKTPGGRYFAHGKDPHFPAWTDTVQVNYFSPAYRRFSEDQLLKIAEVCDGVRCDMTMLGLNRIFEKGWKRFLDRTPVPSAEYWKDLISAVRKKHPAFLFMAESYWELEWELQQLGFNFTYDKKLYDRLIHDPAFIIIEHLKAELSYQEKSVRFIENHDEHCAAKVFGVEKSQAAAVVMSTLPGMRFFHEGQLEGRTEHVPIQLRRAPAEKPIKMLRDFYHLILEYSGQEIMHEGIWHFFEPATAWSDNQTYKNLLVWGWEYKGKVCLIIVNYSNETSQGRVKFPLEWLKQKTITLNDKAASVTYVRSVEELKHQGLYAALPAWKAHLFEFGI